MSFIVKVLQIGETLRNFHFAPICLALRYSM